MNDDWFPATCTALSTPGHVQRVSEQADTRCCMDARFGMRDADGNMIAVRRLMSLMN